MSNQTRMSPLTALFLGVSAVMITCVVAGTGVAVYGLILVDDKVDRVFGLADDTIDGIPGFLQSVTEGMPGLIKALPPVLGDALHDRREPAYAGNLDIIADLRPAGYDGKLHPVVSITNRGEESVTLLCIRVAALDADGAPRREWTEVVATPLAIDQHWRGPLMPQSTRHVVLDDWRGLDPSSADRLHAVYEVSELRVWAGQDADPNQAG